MSQEVAEAIQESIAGLEGSEASESAGSVLGTEQTATPSPSPASPMPGVTVPGAASAAPPAPPATTTPPAPTPKVATEAEAVAEADRNKRRGFIPLDRHESTLQTAREQHEQQIRAMREHTDQQLAEARQQLQLLKIAEDDPDRFLAALAQADPRYAERLGARSGNGHGPISPSGPSTPPGGAPPTAMPGPDAHLPDGSVGYSPEGLKALLDWHAAQVQSQMESRYKPVLDEHEMRAAVSAAEGRVRAKVQAALDWPGFAEAQGDIAKALRADRTLDLHGAYMRVVIPKLKADRDAMRAELLAEIQGKPLKVSTTAPHGAPPAVAHDGDLQSVIRAAIANIPR